MLNCLLFSSPWTFYVIFTSLHIMEDQRYGTKIRMAQHCTKNNKKILTLTVQPATV